MFACGRPKITQKHTELGFDLWLHFAGQLLGGLLQKLARHCPVAPVLERPRSATQGLFQNVEHLLAAFGLLALPVLPKECPPDSDRHYCNDEPSTAHAPQLPLQRVQSPDGFARLHQCNISAHLASRLVAFRRIAFTSLEQNLMELARRLCVR